MARLLEGKDEPLLIIGGGSNLLLTKDYDGVVIHSVIKGMEVVSETDDVMMTVRASLPALLSADLRLAEPRYVTLPAMMKAKKKPIAALKAGDLGLDLADRLAMQTVVEPEGRSGGVKLSGVDELIDVLRNKVKAL